VTLMQRLRRLERSVPDPGCLARRDRRGRAVLVDCQEQRDGAVVPHRSLPAPCAACGKIPEIIMEAVLPYTDDGSLGPGAIFGGEQ
jgi:hypothetical protein